jgi:hypothetical protein
VTLSERLVAAHATAMRLYLRRQEIEAQRARVMQDAMQCDQSLLRSDGEIALLESLIAEERNDGV